MQNCLFRKKGSENKKLNSMHQILMMPVGTTIRRVPLNKPKRKVVVCVRIPLALIFSYKRMLKMDIKGNKLKIHRTYQNRNVILVQGVTYL